MKKQFVIFAVLLFGAVNAQSIKYGVTANLHQSSIVGIHDRSKGVFGGGIGVYADISLTSNDLYDSSWLYFTPQLEYATQGENAKVPNMDNQKFHNSYIGLPLYLKYFLRNQGYKSDIYFMAGPRLEVLVSDKRSGPVSLTAAQEQKINSFGFGISAGVGVKVQDKIDVFLRVDRGFSKVYPDYTRNKTYNRMLGIGINYQLGMVD